VTSPRRDGAGEAAALAEVASLARPLNHDAALNPLVDRLASARVVLFGEASHGTADYYRWRAALTRRLIVEQRVDFVAVEGDWPDCFAVNCWAKGAGGGTAVEVLRRFARWPTWMWANTEVADFLTWLRQTNAGRDRGVGFYGLDVYSLWDSLRAVCDYLAQHQPDALPAAQAAAACFEPYREDPQGYAWASHLVPTSCEQDVLALLQELRRGTAADGSPEAELNARQNAEALAGAERYYRSMLAGGAASWNVRDRHMVATLDRLLEHHGPESRAVVWEHNTHVGDARGTDMAGAGMVTVGQLVRERYGAEAVALVGFAGHRGTVVAAEEWGQGRRVMDAPPAPPATHEDLLHRVVGEPAVFVFGADRSGLWLSGTRGHRAIGVVYEPERDRRNWVPTVLGRRYDALLSFEETAALHPLHAETPQPEAELETWPSGT
jgi:erythromycin esterase